MNGNHLPSWTTLFVVAATVLAMDALWLGYVATPMYTVLRTAINPAAPLSRLPFRVIPAMLAYAAMVLSISVLTVPRAADAVAAGAGGVRSRVWESLFWGGVWGIGVYGTFNATNRAIIGKYPLWVGMVDTLWGMIIGAAGTFAGSYVYRV